MDEESRIITEEVARSVPHLPVIVTTLPLEPQHPFALMNPAIKRVCGLLPLRPMGMHEVELLIRSHLHASHVSDDVIHLLRDRAGGNPRFTMEIAQSLLDASVIEKDSEGRLFVPRSSVPQQAALPQSLLADLQSRLDALDPAQQLLLKLASVVSHADGLIDFPLLAYLFSRALFAPFLCADV
eukprot:TRINITY_DN12650_c0_g1_i7.p2 TRINITY_DN12650_c0_g1~~TRINITY_DN12650_c0_g1_i7.p2  ORF type:complete len:183 (-),score=58.77 TRINITY_DN12650_c0_g1_i7:749-1297(-)